MKLQASLALALAATTAVFAQEAAAPAEAVAEATAEAEAPNTTGFTALEAAVNELGATIGENIGRSNTLRTKLNLIWEDPAYTSEAIEAKRQEIRKFQLAAIKAQGELRELINELPAVKAIADEKNAVDEETKTLRDEYRKAIDTLRKKRFEAQNAPK